MKKTKLIYGMLMGMVLGASAAKAEVSFDASATGSTPTSVKALAFKHTIAKGSDRMLIVSVAIEALKAGGGKAAKISYNGKALSEISGAAIQAGGKEQIQTQMFYLMQSDLPETGAYDLSVEFAGKISSAIVQSSSLQGVKQAAPAGLKLADSSGADKISLNAAIPAGGLLVDVAASGNCGTFTAVSGQKLRQQKCESEMSAATSTQTSGTDSWQHSGANRLVLSAALLLPASNVVMPTPVPPVVVNPPPPVVLPPSIPMAGLTGMATVNGMTTGGAGGKTVTASTLADLRAYLTSAEPMIVQVSGMISGNEAINLKSNKTVIGLGANATLSGVGLKVGSPSVKISNVIIQNLRFEKAIAPLDAVFITNGAHHVWVDHCEFSSDLDHGKDYYDGLLDITHAAEYITVSWNKFSNHYKVSLVGHSDSNGAEDTGHLTVTYHHNLFTNVNSRNASVRFGKAHFFNNYYLNVTGYGIASRQNAELVIENNYFEKTNVPVAADRSLSSVAGKVRGQASNYYKDSGANSIETAPATWVLPYSYSMENVLDVPASVLKGAGVR